jgi:hypothetical protein
MSDCPDDDFNGTMEMVNVCTECLANNTCEEMFEGHGECFCDDGSGGSIDSADNESDCLDAGGNWECNDDDCEGDIYDCLGICDGTAVVDCAGVCGGSALEDCASVCGGDSVLSGCDNACDSIAVEDCAGVCGGSIVEDACGTCGGDITEVSDCGSGCNATGENLNQYGLDCNGGCGGSAVEDECGVCSGNGSPENYNCDGECTAGVDCNGQCGGALLGTGDGIGNDACGICGGSGPPH